MRRAGFTVRVRRQLAFARHIPPAQMARRFHLQLLHRWRVRFPPDHTAANREATLRPDAPLPLLPPRGGAARLADGRWRFRLLNDERIFGWPIPWDLPGAPARDQLWKMTLHYMEYLEGLPDADFVRLIEDWLGHNPPYRPDYWRDTWNSYTTALRIVVWLQQLAGRRAGLDHGFVRRVARAAAQQLAFLSAHLETDLRGNHLIKNIKALLWGARSLETHAAAGWRRQGLRLLHRELEAQVLADGCHYERSPSYHCQVFADLLECHQVLGDHPVRTRLAEALARMAQVVADLSHPDGKPALFNDSGLSMAYAPATCLEVYRRQFNDAPRPRQHVALPQAGYYGLRRGDDLLLVDCGDIGPDYLVAHGHGDMLSFECSIGGRRLVVDPGVYQYYPGEWRRYARSTATHNTVTVADGEQCEFFGAFRCGRRAHARCLRYEATAAGFLLEGSHDGFDRLAGRPRHIRRFEAGPTGIAISDRVENGQGQVVRARLLVHPDWQIDCQGVQAKLRCGRLQVRLTASALLRLEPAWWCPDLGLRLRTRRFVIEYGKAPCHGEFRLERLDGP